MAITIVSNSPVQENKEHLINHDSFRSELFFTSVSSLLYVVVGEVVGTKLYLRFNGKLNAYVSESSNLYRFDLGKYIIIRNEAPVVAAVASSPRNLNYVNFVNTCDLKILNGPTDFMNVAGNQQYIITDTTGTYINISSLASVTGQETKSFNFKDSDRQRMTPTVYKPYYYVNDIISIKADSQIVINIIETWKTGQTYKILDGASTQNGLPTTYLYRVSDCLQSYYIEVNDCALGTKYCINGITIPCTNKTHQYMYKAIDGGYNVSNFHANLNTSKESSREYIKVNGYEKILTNNYINKYTQSTGFDIKDCELMNIVRSEYVYKVLFETCTNCVSMPLLQLILENNSQEDFCNKILTDKNTELVFRETLRHKLNVNVTTKFFN